MLVCSVAQREENFTIEHQGCAAGQVNQGRIAQECTARHEGHQGKLMSNGSCVLQVQIMVMSNT